MPISRAHTIYPRDRHSRSRASSQEVKDNEKSQQKNQATDKCISSQSKAKSTKERNIELTTQTRLAMNMLECISIMPQDKNMTLTQT